MADRASHMAGFPKNLDTVGRGMRKVEVTAVGTIEIISIAHDVHRGATIGAVHGRLLVSQKAKRQLGRIIPRTARGTKKPDDGQSHRSQEPDLPIFLDIQADTWPMRKPAVGPSGVFR